jgi:hypothetical protein
LDFDRPRRTDLTEVRTIIYPISRNELSVGFGSLGDRDLEFFPEKSRLPAVPQLPLSGKVADFSCREYSGKGNQDLTLSGSAARCSGFRSQA